jgi:hypothetical protein
MAKKRTPGPGDRPSVTAEVYSRLYRLVNLLAEASRTRADLTRRLRVDLRKFYRDLEALRGLGVPVAVTEGRYRLGEDVAAALNRLPFPDPHLTLGEVRLLVKGRTAAHRRLKELLDELAP